MAAKKKTVVRKRKTKKLASESMQNCKMPWQTMVEQRKREKGRERVRKSREEAKKRTREADREMAREDKKRETTQKKKTGAKPSK